MGWKILTKDIYFDLDMEYQGLWAIFSHKNRLRFNLVAFYT